MKSIVISADDYGLSSAVDDGILELIGMGRLTATSCLVLSPRWQTEAAAKLTPDIRAKADIGLHLDFTEFLHPMRHRLSSLILKTHLHVLSVEQLTLIITSQLIRFEAMMGTPPDYIDGHQHVHQLPQIREALVRVLTTRYGSKLPWIRIAEPPAASGFKAAVIGSLGAHALRKLCKQHGIQASSRLLGVYGFDVDASGYQAQLDQWLESASQGDVLMCHPATGVNHEITDPIYAARTREFEVFSSERFAKQLKTLKIGLTRRP